MLRQPGPLFSSGLRSSSPGKSSRAGGVRYPGTNRSHSETPNRDVYWSPTLRICDWSFGYRYGHSGSLTTAGSYPWMKDRMGVIMIQAPGHRWRPPSHLLFCILGAGSRISLIPKQLLIPKSIESEHVANALLNLHRKEETRNYSGVTEYKNKMLLVHWESTSKQSVCASVRV